MATEKQSNNNIIEFKNVTKTYKLYKNDKKRLLSVFLKNTPYKKKDAVKEVSFQVKRGEAVALFGKNGAGKSTILKMVTGVTFPTSGEIYVDGTISALLELSAGFDGESSGRDNIYFKCGLLGMEKEEIAALEQEIIDFADIGEYIDQPMRSYSSGMKARLGFAISVNVKPDILIVDEALSVGDKKFRKKCTAKVKEIMANKDVTLLFVTHASETAKAFCERAIVLEKGRKLFEGDIDEAIEFYEGSQ